MSKALAEKRMKAIHYAREILDRCEKENRSLTQEEDSQYNAAIAESESLKATIDKFAALEAQEAELRSASPVALKKLDVGNAAPAGKEERAAFIDYLRGDLSAREIRAINGTSNANGGYLLAPEVVARDVMAELGNEVYVRQFATVYSNIPRGGSLGVPTATGGITSAWGTEISGVSASTTHTFGKRVLAPKPLSMLVKVSRTLLDGAVVDVEKFVRAEIVKAAAEKLEEAYLTGDGSGKPLGIFTASNDGIPTSQDIVGGTTSVINLDKFKDAIAAFKPAYLPRLRWIMNPVHVASVAKAKDSQGRYLWNPNMQAGTPEMLDGIPVIRSAYAPSTVGADNYFAALCDLSGYVIAESMVLSVQVLNELYATTNEVAFLARVETDGAPARVEAFRRLAFASA